MSRRLELAPLTRTERHILAGLCAMADAGEPPVPFQLVKRLNLDRNHLYEAVRRLSDKGWIARRRKQKKGAGVPVRIIARPANIRNQEGYLETLSETTHRHPRDVPQDRDCMTCGTTFRSAGWENRRCERCRSSRNDDEDWMNGAVAS